MAEHIISTFLSLAPLKLGLFSMSDYIGVLRKDKKYRLINTSLSIVVDIIYLAIFVYIYKFFAEHNITEGFEHIRSTRIAVAIITLIVLLVIAFLYMVDKDRNGNGNGNGNDNQMEENKVKKHIKDITGISDKTLSNLEVIIGILFIGNLLYDVAKSSIKFSNGEYTITVDYVDVYFAIGFLFIVMGLKFGKIYNMIG